MAVNTNSETPFTKHKANETDVEKELGNLKSY
jgi:hypothetical protein